MRTSLHVISLLLGAVAFAACSDSAPLGPSASDADLNLGGHSGKASAIVFSSSETGFSQIWATLPDGSRRLRITTNDAHAHAAPAVSPDRRWIAVAVWRDGAWDGIDLVRSNGTSQQRLTSGEFDGSPAWSPNGKQLAFERMLPGPYGSFGRIFVVNANGSGARQLTPNTDAYTFDGSPAWSPDGSKVAFNRSGDLYTIQPDGTGLTLLRKCRLACGEPAWSPDGRQVAFSMYTDEDGDGHAEGHLDVYVMKADGSDVRRITSSPLQEQDPDWSPDGTEIVFARWEDGLSQLYLARLDGMGETKISAGTHHEGSPQWVSAP